MDVRACAAAGDYRAPADRLCRRWPRGTCSRHFLTEERLQQGDISFVGHSFGGLVVEQLLRTASDRSSAEQNVNSLLRRINRVILLGTPHLGADLATWAGTFRLLFLPSFATKGLARNDPHLRDLNLWYRQYAAESGIATRTLVETRNTWFGRVVKPDSADPGLPSHPIPVDADHFGLASPKSKDSEIYRLVRDFLKQPVTTLQPRTVVNLATLDAIATDVAAIERITQRLSATAISEGTLQEIPSSLVDDETEKRIVRLRKMRFFGGSDHVEQASRLARELLQGELFRGVPRSKGKHSSLVRSTVAPRPIPPEVLKFLDAARNLARTEEVSVVEALVDFSTRTTYDPPLGS